MKSWRTNLFKNYKAFNPIFSTAQIDEAVLRLLNRLIFIRTAEDREVEDNRLRSLVRMLKDKKKIKNLDHELAMLFRELDGIYNSELFAKHFSEELKIPPTDLEEIIDGLYEKNYTRYNFNALDADVLGTAYEQYLGHVVIDSTLLSADSETHVEEKRTKRKSQGIYYTPTFVTKYIVQQTVGKYLDKHGYNPSKPLRVLDMACGSGSFLIEAFDVIDRFVMNNPTPSAFGTSPKSAGEKTLKSIGSADLGEAGGGERMRQLEVLQNCIFGVDKDKQAVEVARLNLLLRGLHSREKLPMLENIHHGDSLRNETWDDIAKTLKVFAKHPRSETQGAETFRVSGEGLFDVIIGNPPYVRQETLGEEFKAYAKQNFETFAGTADLYIYFIEQAHKLLKPGGLFGMIVSNKWMRANYGKALRQFLIKNAEFLEIIDFGELPVFENAATFPVIIITRKAKSEKQNFLYAPIKRLDFDSLTDEVKSISSQLDESAVQSENWTLSGGGEQVILDKMKKVGVTLSEYTNGKVDFGIKTGFNEAFYISESQKNLLVKQDKKSSLHIKPLLVGDDIRHYHFNFKEKFLIRIPDGWTNENNTKNADAWVWFEKNYPALANHLSQYKSTLEKRLDKGDYWWELRACDYYDDFEVPKIIYPIISRESRFYFDNDGYYTYRFAHVLT